MCLIAFAWRAHPEYSLVVAANRDEWHERPTAPAAWWDDDPQILAGRDLRAGGTWLGITRNGRFAALTNFRDPAERKSDAPSRGQLVRDFLSGTDAPRDYLLSLRQAARGYQGFNLLAGDGNSLHYFSSRIGEIVVVPPGIHALSNHTLNEPWPKVNAARSALDAALRAKMPEEAHPSSTLPGEERGMPAALHALLSDATIAPDDTLPDTGVGQEWERILSPVLIVTGKYGTRCSTVLTVSHRGAVNFEERTRDASGKVTGTSIHAFELS